MSWNEELSGISTFRRLLRVAAGLSLVVCVLGATMAPVLADTADFRDPADDTFIDIRQVHVGYADQLYLRVGHHGVLGRGQSYAFWLDTKPRNAGPEYYVWFRPGGTAATLERTGAFEDSTRNRVSCPAMTSRAASGTRQDVELRIPGHCLGNPAKVRTSIRFRQRTDIFWDDWASDYREFLGWVPRY